MLQFHVLRNDLGLLGSAEDLLKVQCLTLVGEVQQLLGLVVLHTLNNGSQIGGGIDGSAVRLDQNAGGHFLGVGLFLYRDHQCAVGNLGDALGLHILDHGGDIGLCIAFTQPHIKADIQVTVILLQVGNGQAHNVIPDGTIAAIAILQLEGCFMSTGCKGLVYLALAGGSGVDFFQLRNGEGSFCRILAGESGIKVGQFRLTLADFLDDQAHLQAPVTHVDVANDIVAEVAVDALQAFADDGRTQMADVQGFCHIGTAVVHHHGFCIGICLQTEMLADGHVGHIVTQPLGGDIEVQETGIDGSDHAEHGIACQLLGYGIGNLDGGALIGLGSGHGTVALEFTQVGTIGYGDLAEGRIKAGIFKGLADPQRDQIYEFFHGKHPLSIFVPCIIAKVPRKVQTESGRMRRKTPRETGKLSGKQRRNRSDRRPEPPGWRNGTF